MTPTPVAARPPRALTPEQRQWFDRALVLALLAPAVLLTVVLGVEPVWFGLALLQIVPLWWRRSFPVACFVAVAVASALQVLAVDTPLPSQLAWPVALYSVARFSSTVPALAALLVSLVAAGVASVDWLVGDVVPLGVGTVAPYFVSISAITVTAWTLGTLGRVRAAYVEGLIERNEQTRREAEQRVTLAATEERTRIAREMHDVVAHGLSVIIVQADGARYAAARDPAAAPAALGTIARTGREALADMRRMLGLLREGETGTAPVPDLGSLRTLVEESQVPSRLVGLERDVPGVVALTTYRVVQEALTNVRKHAGPDAGATVDVEVGAAEVVVRVRDRGRGAAATPSGLDGAGHGLVGMRERVSALGGEVSAGPAPGGGFVVSARIPL
jgi:signal transduction histidine kinase